MFETDTILCVAGSMTLHIPAAVASNISADSKVDCLEGRFFFFGGDLS